MILSLLAVGFLIADKVPASNGIELCEKPVVTDGDSIRCADKTKLRLAGIDAPDKPDYCKRRGRVCTLKSWRASKASLKAIVGTNAVSYQFIENDLYKRKVVVAYSGSVNLSCYQIEKGHAMYMEKWNGKYLDCKK